jgi:hypothetical protein
MASPSRWTKGCSSGTSISGGEAAAANKPVQRTGHAVKGPSRFSAPAAERHRSSAEEQVAGYLEIACDTCGFRGRTIEGDCRRAYALGPSEHAPLLARSAWCDACANVVPVEWILSLETLQQLSNDGGASRTNGDEVEKLRFILWGEVEKVFVGSLGGLTEERFARILRGLLRWRQQRQSPPRCLRCGSTAIRFFPDDGAGLPHGSCGGQLLQVGWGLCEPAEEFAELYTVEGDLLQRKRR